MMSYQKARYALWNHASMQMKDALDWRETPKSKHLISVVPPTVLPGTVKVLHVNSNTFTVQLTCESQLEAIKTWLSEVPDHVMPPTVCSNHEIESNTNINVYNNNFTVSAEPLQPNEQIRVRLSCHVTNIGPMKKLQLVIVDVARNGIPAASV